MIQLEDGTLNRSEPVAIRESIQRLVDENQVSQAEVCREAGLSSSAVSTFLKGTYAGNEQNVSDKLSNWLELYKARRAKESALPMAPVWFDTHASQRVMAACQYAQMAGDIVLIYSGAGCGKTCSLKRYAERHPSVWHIEMTKSHARLQAALTKIASGIGLKVESHSPADIQEEIHDRVRNTNGLMIIDESQHLDVASVEALRAIHDDTGIGLVLAGNENVYSRLTGGRRTAQFAQLFSRIGKRVRLGRPPREDSDALAKAWKINGAKERELIFEITQKPGALRGATKALRLAVMFAGGKEINHNHIRDAWLDLGGE